MLKITRHLLSDRQPGYSMGLYDTDIMPRTGKNHDIALLRTAFGRALVAMRERRGMKQQEVASLVGTTRSHLWRMEGGRGDPSLSMLYRLARVLEVSPLEIMRETLKHFAELQKEA